MPTWVVAFLFTATLFAIAARRLAHWSVPRGPTAFVGGLLTALAAGLGPRDLVAALDVRTLALIAAMLLLAATVATTRLFANAASWVGRRARNERDLVLGTLVVSAVLSALVMNDTVALIFPGLVLAVTHRVGLPPFRTLVALAIGVNIGSVWTPVGNPQNAYVATQHGLGFLDFAFHMTPLVVLGLVVAALVVAPGAGRIRFVHQTLDAIPRTHRLGPWLLGTMVVVFTLGGLLGLPLWLGASVLALGGVIAAAWGVPGVRAKTIVGDSHATILLLFVGLFWLKAAVLDAGLLDAILPRFPFEDAPSIAAAARVALVTFVASNVVSNVPAVLLLDIPVAATGIPHWPELLTATATLAGNATIVSSAATLIVAERAEASGARFPFWRFAGYGLPVTVVTLALAAPYFTWLAAMA